MYYFIFLEKYINNFYFLILYYIVVFFILDFSINIRDNFIHISWVIG